MRTKIVRIGNSKGVRIPKAMLQEAGIDGKVDIRVTEQGILIASAVEPRAGWAEAARLIRERREDGLLDPPVQTRFDESEWEWDEE